MGKFFCLVLALMVFTVTDASAVGNREAAAKSSAPDAVQQNFASRFGYFYDLASERRGMIPLTLIDADGKKTTLDAYRGQYILVHFWATWCPPCLKELPSFKTLMTQRQNKNLKILLVSLDYGIEQEKLNAFMKKLNSDLPAYRIPSDDPAWDQLSNFVLPETFIINPQGQVLYKMIGENDWASAATGQFFDWLNKTQKK